MTRFARAIAGLLILSSAGGAAAAGGPLCTFLAACRTGAGPCVLVQLPPREASRIRRSEAYGDMMSQIAQLQARRPAVRQFTAPGDVARYVAGPRRSARTRTIFLGPAGRSIEADGLFVDDPAPILAQFDGTASPGDLPAELRAGRWRPNPTACRPRAAR